jgi:WD40 repeat protein
MTMLAAQTKCSQNVIKLKGHDRSVRGVAFSPRKTYILASGAYDGLLNLYDAKSASLLRSTQVLDGNLRSINAIDFVADGSKIIAGSNSRKLFVVDVETGETISSYENCM